MLRCKFIEKSENYYNISDGAVFTENYNETLDSATILLQQITSEINIEPYDIVMIESYENGLTINTRYLCVDTYSKIQTSLNPPIYKYEINLFSLTKMLEGYLCPNLAITKIPNRILTVGNYISRYTELYLPKTNSSATYGALTDLIECRAELLSYFNAECPEMQWNEPTLREVLNDLMMVQDCIPVVKYDSVNSKLYLDKMVLSYVGEPVENDSDQLNGINYIQETQSSADYVSSLKMHLYNTANNIIDNDISSLNKTTRIVEKIGFRNDETYLLNTENMRLQTTFGIWRPLKFMCLANINTRVYYEIAGGVQLYEDVYLEYEIDLTPYVLEQKEWLTKDVYYGTWRSGGQYLMQLSPDYRNTSLYYVRGEKNIYNFNDKQTYSGLFIDTDEYVFQLIANKLNAEVNQNNPVVIQWFNQSGISGTLTTATSVSRPTFTDVVFTLSYDAMDDCVFVASKEGIPTHIRQVVDNQTNSYVDIERQGLLEYLKAKRLGNKMQLINARYFINESLIPQLAQTLDNKIIFKKEIAVYNNYIDVNYTSIDNYVLKNYYTGVKSKLRSWKIVSGAEAITRAENIKFYINSNIASVNDNYMIPVYNTLASYFANFKECAIRFNTALEGYYPKNTTYYDKDTDQDISIDTNAIQVEFTKHLAGNSAIFTLKMPDNYYAGNYISSYKGKKTYSTSLNYTEQKGIKYADSNGELVGGEIYFYTSAKDIDYNTNYLQAVASRGLKPLVNAGLTKTDPYEQETGLNLSSRSLVARIPFVFYKDSREILQISIQFEMNEDANDMFIGFNKNNGV